MKTEILLRKVAEGDAHSLERLYNALYKLVYATSYSITQNKHDAEDITAEVFVIVWQKAYSFKGENGKSWICQIARNTALTFVSKKNREKTGLIDQLEESSYRIEDQVEKKSKIDKALSVLNEQERQTVLMFNSGYKHREIAQILGESIGTITWRYNNSLKKMRKVLEDNE